MVPNERRATKSDAVTGGTRRAGPLFPPCGVAARLCGWATLRSRRLVWQKNRPRRAPLHSGNRPKYAVAWSNAMFRKTGTCMQDVPCKAATGFCVPIMGITTRPYPVSRHPQVSEPGCPEHSARSLFCPSTHRTAACRVVISFVATAYHDYYDRSSPVRSPDRCISPGSHIRMFGHPTRSDAGGAR